jgi:hypothetical protein
MPKNSDTAPAPPTPPTSPAPSKVTLQAVKSFAVGGMIVAPGCEFSATREKADELIAAGVAVAGLPRF